MIVWNVMAHIISLALHVQIWPFLRLPNNLEEMISLVLLYVQIVLLLHKLLYK